MDSLMGSRLPGLIWILCLLPLSVDQALSLKAGHYDLRLSYLGFALLGICYALAIARGDSIAVAELRSTARSRANRCFLALGATGAISLAGSLNPSRSALFWAWSLGTILGMPLLIRDLRARTGEWVPRTMTIYLSLQSLVVLWDSLACAIGEPSLYVGRVFDWSGDCRPHAGYQEPNYFAGFALFSLLWLRSKLRSEKDAFWKQAYLATAGLACAAILMSTSRAGWVGLAGLAALSFPRRRALAAVAALAFALAIALAAGHSGVSRTLKSFATITEDGSFRIRALNLDASLAVFRENPVVGAGPGGAGAYLVERIPEHPLIEKRYSTPERKEHLRNDPLSFSLFTELLSEWGALGFAVFIAGLALMARPVDASKAWVALVVYSTSQTLPRLDLWVALSVLFALQDDPQAAGKDA